MGFFKSKPEPRYETSAQIHKRYVDACPGHSFTSGERVSATTMRYWCPCGASQDRKVPQ
jgi:hypothetical protein